ncbi:DnaJ domain-containing protein [Infundibulicybe gibba]|nr:DnaJ domain-containing protein [Infundibulicybe gibba]
MASTSASPSLYDILGIESSASIDEVRRAYKQKALETHPDKLDPGASEEEKARAQAKFHKVHAAFEVLGDSQKRKAYDFRMSPKTEHPNWSEEQVRRMKDRDEWARQQDERYQARLDAIAEQKRIMEAKQIAEAEEKRIKSEIAQDLMQTLCEKFPDWEARMKKARQVCPPTKS